MKADASTRCGAAAECKPGMPATHQRFIRRKGDELTFNQTQAKYNLRRL